MKEEDALRVLTALLDREGAAWQTESGWIRFRSKHGAMLWQTACRVCADAMLIYAQYPFRCDDRDGARRLCEEWNRKFVRGALYLTQDGTPVYRSCAELDDAYLAERRLAAALRESAQVIAHCWGVLSGK